MTTMAEIPPRHVEASSLQLQEAEPDHSWPELTPEKTEHNEWEMVPPSSSPQVTFVVEEEPPRDSNSSSNNPKIMKHCQSSPDLRRMQMLLEDDDDEESGVMVEDHESTASSSVVMVSGPSSVWSVAGSSRVSVRDAILQKSSGAEPAEAKEAAAPKAQKVKPKFVVVAQTPKIKRGYKSMGNLRALDHIQEDDHDYNEAVMGDTDASDYYSRKAQGAIGRKNGMKSRPDEAKRLQITMVKKNLQRERQAQR
jgi:hypothetical protein